MTIFVDKNVNYNTTHPGFQGGEHLSLDQFPLRVKVILTNMTPTLEQFTYTSVLHMYMYINHTCPVGHD